MSDIDTKSAPNSEKIKVLVVCRWPVGGIRTYLHYNYRYFSPEEFDVTLVATRGKETEYTQRDMESLGIKVVWVDTIFGLNAMPLKVAGQLMGNKFDLIHSQGFISGFFAGLANMLFRTSHVLTIHGILEPEYFEGRLEKLKRFVFRKVLRSVSVFHSVSRDMLVHVQEQFPSLKASKAEWEVIHNGIAPEPFRNLPSDVGPKLKEGLGLDPNTFVFGFFGRLIMQKGFNYVIDAVDRLRRDSEFEGKFKILILSSGDFVREYKIDVDRKDLNDYFLFQPSQPSIHHIIGGCDAVLMPSNWEAWGLLANEAHCAGVPLIASTCIGLREAIEDTPTLKVPPADVDALQAAMKKVMTDPSVKKAHVEFAPKAAERFDVKHSAAKLMDLFRRIGKRRL